jgi:hypothetical protein
MGPNSDYLVFVVVVVVHLVVVGLVSLFDYLLVVVIVVLIAIVLTNYIMHWFIGLYNYTRLGQRVISL